MDLSCSFCERVHDQLKSSIMLESLVKMTCGFVLAQPFMGFGSFLYPISIKRVGWILTTIFSMVQHAEMVFQDDIVTSLTNLPWLGFWFVSRGWDSNHLAIQSCSVFTDHHCWHILMMQIRRLNGRNLTCIEFYGLNANFLLFLVVVFLK